MQVSEPVAQLFECPKRAVVEVHAKLTGQGDQHGVGAVDGLVFA